MKIEFNESGLEGVLKLIEKNRSANSVMLKPTEMIMSDVAVDMVLRGEIDPPKGMRFVSGKAR